MVSAWVGVIGSQGMLSTSYRSTLFGLDRKLISNLKKGVCISINTVVKVVPVQLPIEEQ